MHIKRIVLEGFRVYRARVQPDDLSPRHNVVVGANGSGKSNFFAAISFVLGELGSSNQMPAEERRRLLHEGVGHAVSSAFVEIHFDNTDGSLPVERSEVAVKRVVNLRKDEYFVDGKRATKTEVANLLESAGLSRSDPTHIVPQGRVLALTTMKDEARLSMLREVAGTSAYDARRQESLNIMLETKRQKERIADAIQTIEARLKQLDVEKIELRKYRDLEKRQASAGAHRTRLSHPLRTATLMRSRAQCDAG